MSTDDDVRRGRVLPRREALALLGATGFAILTPRSTLLAGPPDPPGCIVRPEQTEGPYFVDERLNRADIRSDPADGSLMPGTPLDLIFRVSQLSAGACTTLRGMLVDIWHCNHLGIYSDVRDPDFNTMGKKFLRGYQVTDAQGTAAFATIYPGWYPGRAVHVHFKIRSAPTSATGCEFVSQVYFDDALTDRVHAQQPYSVRGPGRTRNVDDQIFSRGGSQLMLAASPSGRGYAATFDIALARCRAAG